MQMMKKQLLCRSHLYPHLFLKKARMLSATREVFSGSADWSKNKIKTKKARPQQQKYQPKRSKGPTIYQPFLKS
jgi:hypothetical protein